MDLGHIGIGQRRLGPLPLIRRLSQKEGIALEDYNARELSVNVGEDLRILREINAWGWVENQQKQTGWVPISKFAEYSHESN